MDILYPMFGMIGLSAVMIVVLNASRIPGIVRGWGNLQMAKHSDELWPRLSQGKRYITDNHNHLFEQPTLFYALVVYLYLAQHVDSTHVIIAWLYVVLRSVHSLIQTTTNNVSIRAVVFILSGFCMVLMIAREALLLSNFQN